jgi:1,4-dihydroxy-2-naphthoate polyprenyltransferase
VASITADDPGNQEEGKKETDSEHGPRIMNPLKKWIVAARPWALPASSMPVVFGTSLAVVIGGARLNPFRFLLALAAMMILHSAANMLSDVFDFRQGLDTEVTPVSGAVVRGWLSPCRVAAGSAVLFASGIGLGIWLVGLTGPALFFIGAAGVAVGASYTFLKSRALGDLAVFLNFGILGSLGAWVVQTRSFSWLPIIWTVPLAMLVSAILHANNWRDLASDGERNVFTMAHTLGDRGSQAYYGVLLFGSMALILLFTAVPRFVAVPLPALPPTFLIVLAAFPRALKLWGRARRRIAPEKPMDFVILDGATADYNLLFGLLCTGALWLDAGIRAAGIFR